MATYHSSRGRSPEIGFGDTLLGGLAPDGGLYLPTAWPELPKTEGDYASIATAVMAPFVADTIGLDDFGSMVEEAYAAFSDPQVCPLVELEPGHHLLELFHGPTLAFKDVALQLLGRLFDHELERRDQRVTIVGATSGDTGSAAMDAVRDRDRVDIVILFPKGRTSEVQRRQMTTLDAPNVHAVAVDGTFDDCQDLVKQCLPTRRSALRRPLGGQLHQLGPRDGPDRLLRVGRSAARPARHPHHVLCPTGNFGNVFAGHCARRMGLPIERLLVAPNTNDILTRLIHTGTMTAEAVVPTLSPSMDIQISSNLERLLFELLGANGPATAELLTDFRATGSASLRPEQHAELIAGFAGGRLDDSETLDVIRDIHDSTGMLVEPHTAVGIGVARRLRRADETVVTLATAHPAKFPDAVEQATGVRPPLPAHLADLYERTERITDLPNDLATVEDFVDSVRRR